MAAGKTTKSFRLAMKDWSKASTEAREALARQSIQEVAYRVVQKTPVDTGFLRGQWQPSIGKMAETPLTKTGKATVGKNDKTGGAVGAKIAGVVLGMKLGETFFMSNNTIYAMRLEYGFVGEDSLGRKYHQAGRYFVTSTMAEWDSIVQEQAKLLGMVK